MGKIPFLDQLEKFSESRLKSDEYFEQLFKDLSSYEDFVLADSATGDELADYYIPAIGELFKRDEQKAHDLSVLFSGNAAVYDNLDAATYSKYAALLDELIQKCRSEIHWMLDQYRTQILNPYEEAIEKGIVNAKEVLVATRLASLEGRVEALEKLAEKGSSSSFLSLAIELLGGIFLRAALVGLAKTSASNAVARKFDGETKELVNAYNKEKGVLSDVLRDRVDLNDFKRADDGKLTDALSGALKTAGKESKALIDNIAKERAGELVKGIEGLVKNGIGPAKALFKTEKGVHTYKGKPIHNALDIFNVFLEEFRSTALVSSYIQSFQSDETFADGDLYRGGTRTGLLKLTRFEEEKHAAVRKRNLLILINDLLYFKSLYLMHKSVMPNLKKGVIETYPVDSIARSVSDSIKHILIVLNQFGGTYNLVISEPRFFLGEEEVLGKIKGALYLGAPSGRFTSFLSPPGSSKFSHTSAIGRVNVIGDLFDFSPILYGKAKEIALNTFVFPEEDTTYPIHYVFSDGREGRKDFCFIVHDMSKMVGPRDIVYTDTFTPVAFFNPLKAEAEKIGNMGAFVSGQFNRIRLSYPDPEHGPVKIWDHISTILNMVPADSPSDAQRKYITLLVALFLEIATEQTIRNKDYIMDQIDNYSMVKL